MAANATTLGQFQTPGRGMAGSGEPAARWGPTARRSGYSIVELLIVLLVISLITFIAVPAIEVARFKMDGAARGGVSALVAAQRLAVKRQHDVVVMFDTVNRRLLIHEDQDNDAVLDSSEPVRPVRFDDGVIFGRGRAPYYGEDAGAITFTETMDGLPAVRFIRNGSASEAGAFYLTSARSSRAAEYAKDSRMVRVDRPTGRVSWYRYDPPQWKEEF